MTMDSKWVGITPGGQHPVQHGLAFLFSGCLAFIIDASLTKALIALVGMHPILARLIAISIAMFVGWLAHRRFTFRLTTPPRFAESCVTQACSGRWQPSTTGSS
jgi:putative flippase GtrA